MEVFKTMSQRYGGPLALGEYLDPSVPSPAQREQQRQLNADSAKKTAPAHEAVTGRAVDATNTYMDRKNFFEAVLHDHDFSLVATFLLSGVRVDEQRSIDGATPLHVAVAGSTRPISDLLHRRHHSSHTGRHGDGGVADSEEKLDPPCLNRLIIAFLIDNGADIDAATSLGGETPLMVACASQNVRAVNLLLAKGASWDVRDVNGRTCLSYAALHPHVLQTMIVWMGEARMAAMARETSLLHTVCRVPGTRYAALYLIEQLGLDVNAAENALEDSSATHTATARHTQKDGHDGEDVYVPMQTPRSRGGETPLHCAVEAGDLALVMTLLAKGAKAQAVNAETGRTPLDLARASLSSAVSRLLRVNCLLGCIPCHLTLPGVLVTWLSVFVNHVGLRYTDVESAAQWGPTAQALAIRSLVTYCASTPPARAEVYLARLENSAPSSSGGAAAAGLLRRLCMWPTWGDMAAFRYFDSLVALAIVPQVFMYAVAYMFRSFLVNVAAVAALVALFVQLKRTDEKTVGCRPLRTAGFALGMLAMQGLCLPLYTTYVFYSYYVFDEEPHKALTLWLIPSAVVTAGCFLFVILFSPGAVSSTAGHRKGIYASIAHAKAVKPGKADAAGISDGALPRELVYSIDLGTMVKKPLRAQRCPQTGRVVLRYDHYCAYLASPIGAGNHRFFFYGLLAMLSLLSAFHYYARGYHRMVSSASAEYVAYLHKGGYVSEAQREIMRPLENILFSTPYHRFGYMHTQVILPVMMLLTFVEIYSQFFAIMRGVTWFDLEHAHTESSIYCFTLSERVYSLFDKGSLANLRAFLLFTEDLSVVTYRVPQMSERLKKVVEEHQRWQLASGSCGCDHDHGEGEHHGTDPVAGNGDSRGVVVASAEPHSHGEAAANAGQSHRHGHGHGQRAENPVEAAKARAVAAVEHHEEQSNTAGAAGGNDGGGAVVPPSLAQYVFQEMIRSGTEEIAIAQHRDQRAAATGSASGVPDQTQAEWESAVEQARHMYRFFKHSIATAPAVAPGY